MSSDALFNAVQIVVGHAAQRRGVRLYWSVRKAVTDAVLDEPTIRRGIVALDLIDGDRRDEAIARVAEAITASVSASDFPTTTAAFALNELLAMIESETTA